MNEIYYFTQNQLKVLLKGSGYSVVSGIALNNTILDNSTVLNTLNELTNMKIIAIDGNSFCLNNEIREIVSSLGNALEYISVRSSNPYLPDKCCFNGGKILVCYSRSQNENYISAYFANADDLFLDFCDEGYFPKKDEDFPINEDELIEYESESVGSIQPDKPIASNSPMLFSAECAYKDGTVHKYVRIIDYYFYNYILYFDGTEVIREIYKRCTAKKYFERLMSGK